MFFKFMNSVKSLEPTALIIPLPTFYLYRVGTLEGVFWSCLILTEKTCSMEST